MRPNNAEKKRPNEAQRGPMRLRGRDPVRPLSVASFGLNLVNLSLSIAIAPTHVYKKMEGSQGLHLDLPK